MTMDPKQRTKENIENSNRPFLSSPQPAFQSEAKCEVFVMKISFELITITKISHLDSL